MSALLLDPPADLVAVFSMLSPVIRMSRPRPMKVLQELVKTAAAARAINKMDFITHKR